jgi:[ribosomal protein S5]-alanine N-acetyltransferase
MGHPTANGREIVLETDRLVLRPWRVSEAGILRELWSERDPRVPPHRRIDAEGRPTVEDLEDRIRSGSGPNPLGLLAAERKGSGEVIGYCGLTENTKVPEGEPELAFEFLRRVWGQGYATEASWAVLSWAEASGYPRLWATVSDWNVASRRVLAKLGFVETGRVEPAEVHGDVLFTTKQLHPLPDPTGAGSARSSSVATSTVDDGELAGRRSPT